MLQCLKRQLKVDSGDWQSTSGNFDPVFPFVSLYFLFSLLCRDREQRLLISSLSVCVPGGQSEELVYRYDEKLVWPATATEPVLWTLRLPKRDDISIMDRIFGSGVLLEGRACWNNTFTIFKYLFVFPVINICEEHGNLSKIVK